MSTLHNSTRIIAEFEIGCGLPPRHSTYSGHRRDAHAEVIVAGLAALQQLNNAIAAAAVAMDDDDEPLAAQSRPFEPSTVLSQTDCMASLISILIFGDPVSTPGSPSHSRASRQYSIVHSRCFALQL